MKRQIRCGVFETNSSSTHSITMMMKKDYDRWKKEGLYLCTSAGYGWKKEDAPQINTLYTKDEVIEFLKKNEWYKDEDTITDEMLEDLLNVEVFVHSDYKKGYLESYYEEFTTPSGETVVAFGQYGYDG